MDGLVMTGQLLLGLSILIVLHELGHFWAARAFGIKVEKFYLFFDAWGFKLFSFNYKGCEYGIGWLLLLTLYNHCRSKRYKIHRQIHCEEYP